jgi:hypothetical protein
MNNTFCSKCHRIPSQCCCLPVSKAKDRFPNYESICLQCGTTIYKPVKEQDAIRYQWLRNEFAHGRETYLAEGMPSGKSLDKYIDEQLRKAQ